MKKANLLVLILTWSVAVILGYYLVHKPVNPQQEIQMAQAGIDILLSLGLISLAGAIGNMIWNPKKLAPEEIFAFQVGLGIGVLGLVWLGLGLLGLWKGFFAWVFLLSGLVILRRRLKSWLLLGSNLVDEFHGANTYIKILAALSGLVILWQLFYALAPPTAWDSLAYHLELPKQYLAEERFLMLESNPLWGRSQLTEMIFTWAMALRGAETATTVGWFINLMFLIGLYGTGKRISGKSGAWIALISMIAGYTFRTTFSWGYVDGYAALLGLSVLVIILDAVDQLEPTSALICGLFLGLSMGVKFTAMILLLVASAVVFILAKAALQNRITWLVRVALVALVVASPWLLKNWLTTGNPLYPNLFPTDYVTAERLQYYQGEPKTDNFALENFILPLAATGFGVDGGEEVGVSKFYADIGPVLVLLSIPGLALTWQKKSTRFLSLWLLLSCMMMVVGAQFTPLLWQTRYFFSLLPAAAIAAGAGWVSLQEIKAGRIRLQRIIGAILLIVVLLFTVDDSTRLIRDNQCWVLNLIWSI